MPTQPALSDDALAFVRDGSLATLSTIGPSGLIHAVAVGFTLADGVIRIITVEGSQKVLNIERDARASIAQITGPRWISFSGTATIEREPDAVASAVALYSERYRAPLENPRRVAIRLQPERILGSPGFVG